MNDFDRLLDTDATDAERRLLRSARLDAGPSNGKALVLGALGLAGATAVSAPASGALALFGKWVAIGALAGALTSGSYEVIRSAVSQPAETRAVPAASNTARRHGEHGDATRADVAHGEVASAQNTGPTPRAELASAGEPSADDRARAVAATVSPPENASRHATDARSAAAPTPALDEARASATTSAVMRPSLEQEVQALDVARTALAANDASAALAALDEYDRRFTEPRLAPESALLRVEALVALGRRNEARRLGERWLARDPSGTHADRLRSLLGDTSRSNGDQPTPGRP